MKKIIAFILAALILLPVLFTGTAQATLGAPENFRAYGFGDKIKLEWEYKEYNGSGMLNFIIYEYDFTTLKWKELGSVEYPQKSVKVRSENYGRHIFKMRAMVKLSSSNKVYSAFSRTNTAYLLKKPDFVSVSVNKLGPPNFKGSFAVSITWGTIKNHPFSTHIGIYRKTADSNTFKILAFVEKSKTGYKDLSAKPNTEYIYGIGMIRKNSNDGDDVSPTLDQEGTIKTLPESPKNFSVKAKGSTVFFKWTQNKNCNGLKLYRKNGSADWKLVGILKKESNAASMKNQNPGKYVYQLVSYNESGNSPYASIQTAYVLKTPTGLKAFAISDNRIDLKYDLPDAFATEINVYASTDGKSFVLLGSADTSHKFLTIRSLRPNMKYYFKITFSRSAESVSLASNVATATTLKAQSVPDAPANLTAVASGAQSITIKWADNSENEKNFVIERKTKGGTYKEIARTVETRFTDNSVSPNTTYYYRVRAFNGKGYSGYTNSVSVKTLLSAVKKAVIALQPDSKTMTVNGVRKEIDPGRETKPVIIPKWGRTVVPIRAIVEASGGTIGWDPKERKVTINFNDTVINLWIDKPKAEVNGVMKWIDPNNHDVKPIIVNGRTMLPLRFVAENLGCKVDWDPTTRTITITYPAP